MKKKLNIFGRKVPVFAILIALLVIGTASAAVFLNYATLSGTVNVSNGVSVSSGDETYNANGGIVVDFTDVVDFTINNENDEPIIVNLVTTLSISGDEGVTWTLVDQYEGLIVDYSVIEGTGIVEATGEGTLVLVPPGGLTVEVEFDAADNALPGDYEVTVAIDYSDADYVGFDGENEIETLEMFYKDEGWNEIPTDTPSRVNFAPMGNEFYYELTATGLTPDIEYSLIYYADQPNQFNNWGGDSPGALIVTGTANESGIMITSGSTDIDMNMPHQDDFNYPDGAKLWIVPADSCGETEFGYGFVSEWDREVYQFEHELITYIDTDL